MPDEPSKPFEKVLEEAPAAPDTVRLIGTIERLRDDPGKFNLRMPDGRKLTLSVASVKACTALANPTPPFYTLEVDSKEVPSDFPDPSTALSSYVAPAGLSVPSLDAGNPGMGTGPLSSIARSLGVPSLGTLPG